MTHKISVLGGLACAAVLALSGCASGPDIRADYDKAADFSKYRTYGFVAQAGTDAGEFKSLATQMLQNSAAREMEARGYVRSATPDLVINFKGKLEEKTDIESVPAPYYGPGWGYGGWYGSPYGGWGGGTQTYTRRYNVGTLIVDVVDREKRQVVFQGGLEDVVTKEMLKNREQTISNAVSAIFSKYPFVAGQGTPVALPDQK
ncbi:MAG TPA: DUF4136 domain-containing protein [Steroidobacteraceae bacterium]|nr:DUF4136 domain-containing protein [Steroidobacteraceae bacterium]